MPTPRWRSHQGGVGGGARRPRHGLSRTKLYQIWNNMRRKDELLKKRIVMYPAWKEDFRVFQEWAMTNGYIEDPEMVLLRMDEHQGYKPTNCFWIEKEKLEERPAQPFSEDEDVEYHVAAAEEDERIDNMFDSLRDHIGL